MIRNILTAAAFALFFFADAQTQPVLKDGFPIPMPENFSNGYTFAYTWGVNIADLNDDGRREIIIGSGHQVFVFDWRGQALAGWPHTTDYIASPTPAVGDLDGDGQFEIVAIDRWESVQDPSRLYAWHHDGTPVPGFPSPPGLLTDTSYPPVLYDVDADGMLAIILVRSRASNNPRQYEIYIFDHRGEIRPGFPVRLPGWGGDKPAIGDVDGDGRPDIVTFATLGDSVAIHVTGIDGTSRCIWRIERQSFEDIWGPALADLDLNPGLDIIFTQDYRIAPRVGAGRIHAINSDGISLDGFPVDSVAGRELDPYDTSASLADIDGDGIPEIFAASGFNSLLGLRAGGTFLPGWPREVSLAGMTIRAFAPPTIGDIDGDGMLDVLTGSNHVDSSRFGMYYAFDVTGNRKSWSPLLADGVTIPQAAITDLEDDGALDIVFVTLATNVVPNSLYAFSMGPGTYDPGQLPWPQYGHDRHLTSQYGYVPTDVMVAVHEPEPTPSEFVLHRNYPNPFNPATTISYSLPIPALVTLKVYDLHGRELETLVDRHEPAGTHRPRFDGGNLASGMYIFKLRARASGSQEAFVAQRKMLLLR